MLVNRAAMRISSMKDRAILYIAKVLGNLPDLRDPMLVRDFSLGVSLVTVPTDQLAFLPSLPMIACR
ncbi:hypothetical protein HDF11_001281 [Tunturiibacter psychrotolerans]|jgi:hypothetical protein